MKRIGQNDTAIVAEQYGRALLDAAQADSRHHRDEDGLWQCSYRKAAVLIALTNRPQPGVILTQRPQWLRSHAGQVAFPGGKIDEGDRDAPAAALREAEEEIALAAAQVAILGTAPAYHSNSGYHITPVLATIPADLPLIANPVEVEEWFEVPAHHLFAEENYHYRQVEWQGKQRGFYDMTWKKWRIWGITAGIILNLARGCQELPANYQQNGADDQKR